MNYGLEKAIQGERGISRVCNAISAVNTLIWLKNGNGT